MPWWQWLVDVVGAALLLLVLFAVALVARRRWLERAGGTFELSFRAGSEPAGRGRGWILGAGRYTGEALECFRIFSLSLRPRETLRRSQIEYAGQRAPSGTEAHALYSGHVIVTCRRPRGDVELAMAAGAVTGFLAWLEAAPPGRGTRPV